MDQFYSACRGGDEKTAKELYKNDTTMINQLFDVGYGNGDSMKVTGLMVSLLGYHNQNSCSSVSRWLLSLPGLDTSISCVMDHPYFHGSLTAFHFAFVTMAYIPLDIVIRLATLTSWETINKKIIMDGRTVLDVAVRTNVSAALYLSWLGAECREENRNCYFTGKFDGNQVKHTFPEVSLQTWMEAGCQNEAQYWAVAAKNTKALKILAKMDNVSLDKENLIILAKIFKCEDEVRRAIENPLLKLFMDKTYTDVEIICQGKSFYSHKILLAAHSDVFKTIIDNMIREERECKVEIPECTDVNVAENFIKYFYIGKIEKGFFEANLVMLLYLSDFYNVRDLKETVEERMLTKLSKETVKDFLIAGDMYRGERVKAAAMEFLKHNKGVWVEDQEEWKAVISKELLCELVTKFI